jgi:hypothetical protein
VEAIPFSIVTADGGSALGGELTITAGDPTQPGWVGAVCADGPMSGDDVGGATTTIWLRLDGGPLNGHLAEGRFTDAITLEGLTGFTKPTVDSPRV